VVLAHQPQPTNRRQWTVFFDCNVIAKRFKDREQPAKIPTVCAPVNLSDKGVKPDANCK
jgi:hypothetical protein